MGYPDFPQESGFTHKPPDPLNTGNPRNPRKPRKPNKRTALFAANAALLAGGTGQLLVVPVELADQFNDLIARAYIHGERAGVKDLLRRHGRVPTP